MDECARQVKKFRISPVLFHEMWVNAAPKRVAAKLHRVDPNQIYEDMVDQVALIMFPTSRYVRRLEDTLLTPRRCESVNDVEYGIGSMVARYLRLAHRRGRDVCLANVRFREVVIESLPERVEDELRRHKPTPANLDDQLALAYQYEDDLARKGEDIATFPEEVFATEGIAFRRRKTGNCLSRLRPVVGWIQRCNARKGGSLRPPGKTRATRKEWVPPSSYCQPSRT